jgi:hypothetical protein
MPSFSLDNISESGAAQPDSPWIRYTIDCGPGAPGYALVNEPQVADMSAEDIRAKVLDRLNTVADAQTKPVVIAQLRTSGIRVHMNM